VTVLPAKTVPTTLGSSLQVVLTQSTINTPPTTVASVSVTTVKPQMGPPSNVSSMWYTS
jgi:hypothetical protein